MSWSWISVKDKLPETEGWYLVWAPTYTPSRNKEKVAGGYMFVRFRPNYKIPWGIESQWNRNEVKYWMPLPNPPVEGETHDEL